MGTKSLSRHVHCICYGQQNLKMYDLKRDIKNDSTLNTVRIMGKLK